MFDWDTIISTPAKGNGFVGTTRADEDAYYAAFADDRERRHDTSRKFGRLAEMLDLVLRRPVS